MALARILLKCPTRASRPFKALANVWLQFCGFLPTFKPLPCSFFKPMANFLPKECNMDRIYDNTKDRCSTTYGHILMQMKLKYPETFISRKKRVVQPLQVIWMWVEFWIFCIPNTSLSIMQTDTLFHFLELINYKLVWLDSTINKVHLIFPKVGIYNDYRKTNCKSARGW